MDQLNEMLLSGLGLVLTAIFGVVARKISQFADSKGYVEKIKHHKELSMMTVKMIEQLYGDFGGEEKKEKAIDALQGLLSNIGIKLTDEEVDMFIESAVLTMKDQVYQTTGSSIKNESGKMEIKNDRISLNHNSE